MVTVAVPSPLSTNCTKPGNGAAARPGISLEATSQALTVNDAVSPSATVMSATAVISGGWLMSG